MLQSSIVDFHESKKIHGKLPSWCLLYYAMIATVFPEIIRSMPLFIVYSIVAVYVVFLQIQRGMNKVSAVKELSWFYLFIAVSFLYFLSSMLFGSWLDTYFYNKAFIPRQSYFIFFLPIFIICGIGVYFNIHQELNAFLIKKPVRIIVVILTFDFFSAFMFGDMGFREVNDFAYLLEKSLIWLFVCYIYYFGIVYGRNKHGMFLTVTFFILLQRLAGYGHMFNAATGAVMYLYMLVFYFCYILFRSTKWLIIFLSLSLLAITLYVLVFPFFSELFIFDLNTYWRLETWRSNLETVSHLYGFGAGFGVSYFPNEIEIVEEVYRSWLREGQLGNMVDQLFIRGQHSSLINIIFRTGVLGFFCFTMFIFNICKNVYLYRWNKDVLFLSGVFFSGFSNISVHVGLESPPFLISIGLSFGALLYCLIHARENKISNYKNSDLCEYDPNIIC